MDRVLVERAMDCDHDAFSELARVSVGRLLSVARPILHDDAAAEDATQETLVAAWSHIHELRDPDRFEPWIHRMLVNACYREARRHHARRAREVHLHALDVPEPDSTSRFMDHDQLERGFRRLDVDQRAVLVLYYFVGLNPDEAAAVLGLPPGTVPSRLHRAMQAMRAALDADARAAMGAEGRTT